MHRQTKTILILSLLWFVFLMSTEGIEKNGLTLENINPNIARMNYIVGGTLGSRCKEIMKKLAAGKKYPFTEVIMGQVGDLQGLGEKPITFLKQVTALVHCPEGMNSTEYPADVKQRAKDLMDEMPSGSAAAYTDTEGLDMVRTHVAEFITKRDGVVPSKKEDIFLCAASTNGVRVIFKLFADQCRPKQAGIMFSIPLYSLFATAAAENGIYEMNYYMDETKDWNIEEDELNRAYDQGKPFCEPRAMFIVNPTNPTGQVMTRDNIEMIIRFANKKKLLVVADEVYQDNAHRKERPFVSFRKVMYELGAPYDKTQLISIYSTSKGYMGETGVRAGYIEVVNLSDELKSLVARSMSGTMNPSVLGQAMLSCVTKPPQKGDPSYELFMKEKTAVLNKLYQRGKALQDTLNGIDGITCSPFYGAMSLFPNVTIPPKAIAAAKEKGLTPDVFWASELLETKGVCVIPGSDFRQRPGTYHFRITNLPQPEQFGRMLGLIKAFQPQFLQKYQ